MTHHDMTVRLAAASPVLAWPVCVLLGAIGLFHVARLGQMLAVRRAILGAATSLAGPEVTASSPASSSDAFLPAECGHILLAAGMAVMLVGSPRLTMSRSFTLGFVVLGLGLLGVLLLDRRCCQPRLWGCCTMLILEAFAMAAMAAGWMTGGFLRTATVYFAVMAAVGAARLAVRIPGFPLGIGTRRMGPPPALTQLAMAAGMLVMLR
jgi:hypothetical protein